MKLLVQLARILVGALFVFSGFVKLVDPIGSQFKFEEYFHESVLDMEYLIPYALAFSIVLIISEIVLGIAILVGYKTRATVFSLLGMILVFTFLTWYSAYYNKVTDCGCFGDALKLTPWQSFYKDLVLFVMILLLVFRLGDIKPIVKGKLPMILTFLSFIASLYVTYHVLLHLPVIDFRAYAVGTNIQEGMKYIGDNDPKIHDFYLEDAQSDLAPQILEEEKVLLVLVYDLQKADTNGFKSVKEITEKALKKGYAVYGASASFTDELILAKEKYELSFDFLFCDKTTLKTMIRANPGLMILNKGTIKGKWNWSDVSQIEL